MHLAYLFSRYPVISQTFCDTEMIALERLDWSLEIGSIYPPHTSFRHGHARALRAPITYAPPQQILRIWEDKAKRKGRWPAALVAAHEQRYGHGAKAAQRARNALPFADLYARHAVRHFHVHFANRAAQTALFIKAISGIPFSITAHGQDFMTDLGDRELLREICREAEFVAAETDYSCGLLRAQCPDSAAKIHRVYNGMDFGNFLHAQSAHVPAERPVKILSVGRLIAFKGFADLLAACAILRERGIEFSCEIIGEGPLRPVLEQRIAELKLHELVRLAGALPQEEIFARLADADIFALASITDSAGASDVFPTVILEAMAAARPVVSTRLAGIPESVIDGKTGLLVAPGDAEALARALETLARDAELRTRFGSAGRARVDANFRVVTTVRTLQELFEAHVPAQPPTSVRPLWRTEQHVPGGVHRVAYLIDRWPDPELPLLAEELREMRARSMPIRAFVCEAAAEFDVTTEIEELATELEFLPDATVIEAEWQQARELARRLENQRGEWARGVPAALFFRQARFALTLRRLLLAAQVSHLHATSTRALVCALLLHELLGIGVSATVQHEPGISSHTLRQMLALCRGGRVADRKMSDRLSSSFLLQQNTLAPARLLRQWTRIDLTGTGQLWQEWSERLVRWSREQAPT